MGDEDDNRRWSPEAVVVGATFDAVVIDALDSLPGGSATVERVDIDGLTYGEAADQGLWSSL